MRWFDRFYDIHQLTLGWTILWMLARVGLGSVAGLLDLVRELVQRLDPNLPATLDRPTFSAGNQMQLIFGYNLPATEANHKSLRRTTSLNCFCNGSVGRLHLVSYESN